MRTIARCDCCEVIIDTTTLKPFSEVDGLLTIRILGKRYSVCEECNKKPAEKLLAMSARVMLKRRRAPVEGYSIPDKKGGPECP